MKIHLFKQIEYKPQTILSISSTDTKIYLFRSNKSCEILNTITLQPLFSFNVNLFITKSFVFESLLIGISNLDDILYINLENYSINIQKIGYKITDFIIKDNKLFLTTYNGFLLEVNGEDIQVRFKTTGILNCLFQYGNSFLIGGKNKIYILEEDFTLKNEMDLDAEPQCLVTNIRHVSEYKFGLITSTGLFIFLDIILLNIIQKIQIRDTSLNVLLIKEGVLYTSGMDSRLISYKLVNNFFVKGYQLDLHFGISKCILWDHNRILIGNTDGVLSILIPQKDNFKYTKIYDRNIQVKSCKDKILINNRHCLELFSISSELKKDFIKNIHCVKDNCTFKISKDINLSVKNLPYRNLLRIYSKFITTCFLEDNKLIYCDVENTKSIELENENIVQNNILDNLKVKEIYKKNNNLIFKSYNDTIINEVDNDESIICEINDYKLVQENSFDVIKKYKIYYKNIVKKKIETPDFILKIFIFENEIWYFTQSYLYNVERNSRFDLEAVIYDVIISNKKVVVVKDDLKYIKHYIEQGAYKKKYSTK